MSRCFVHSSRECISFAWVNRELLGQHKRAVWEFSGRVLIAGVFLFYLLLTPGQGPRKRKSAASPGRSQYPASHIRFILPTSCVLFLIYSFLFGADYHQCGEVRWGRQDNGAAIVSYWPVQWYPGVLRALVNPFVYLSTAIYLESFCYRFVLLHWAHSVIFSNRISERSGSTS